MPPYYICNAIERLYQQYPGLMGAGERNSNQNCSEITWVDFNENGRRDSYESTGLNQDGSFNSFTAGIFLGLYQREFAGVDPYFRNYFYSFSNFRPSNFLHTIFSIESTVTSSQNIQMAYDRFSNLLFAAHQLLAEARAKGINLSNQDKMFLLYSAMYQSNMRFYQGSSTSLLTVTASDDHDDASGWYNCSSALLLYSISRELGWPVYIRRAGPRHTFVHWGEDSDPDGFNMDITISRSGDYSFPRIYEDNFYIVRYDLPKQTIGILYLRNLTENEMTSYIEENAGIFLGRGQRYDEALRYFDRAISLDSNNIKARYNRAVIYARTGRDSEALQECGRILALHPGHQSARRLTKNILSLALGH